MDFCQKDEKCVALSPSILVWAIVLLAIAWFLFQILDIILLFFLAIVFSAALEPIIQRLMIWRFPRSLAIASVYIGLFLLFMSALTFLIPFLFRETQQMFTSIPEILSQWGISSELLRSISQGLEGAFNSVGQGEGNEFLKGVFSKTADVIRSFVGLLAVFAMSLYILAVDGGVKKFFLAIIPQQHREYYVPRAMEAYFKTGRWLIGQVFLMGVVFVVYFIILTILGVPGAFALSVWGGLFEIVPYIGPTIAAIPAVILGFLVSPFVGIMVLLSYAFVQKLENYWLVPKVMERAIGLHPIVIILAILAGGKTGGFLGLLVAIPAAAVISVFLRDIFERKEKE